MPKATFKGLPEFSAKLKNVAEQHRKRAAAALYVEGNVEMTESKKRCPVDNGILRGTGHVEKPVIDGNRIFVDLVYGGAAEAYAVVQHENLEFEHKVGQAKYLESVLMESAPFMGGRIASRIQIGDGFFETPNLEGE